MASIASSSVAPSLITYHVQDVPRLFHVYEEVCGWKYKADERENGFIRPKPDFAGSNEGERASLKNYYNIAEKIDEIISGKLGYLGLAHKFETSMVIAAYDRRGNLQGVCVLDPAGKKGVAGKIRYLITAFRNMPFSEPQSSIRVKGTGSALLAQSIKTLDTLGMKGALFVEPTEAALTFYNKRNFTTIPGWRPRDFGAVCGMALATKEFETFCTKYKGVLGTVADLPKPIYNYLSYLPSGIKVIPVLGVEDPKVESKFEGVEAIEAPNAAP